nr:hypothetical protein GCM10017606_25510 [Microbacterium terregens]
MTKLEEYTSKAEASLAAAEAATSERDRAFHRRAHTIWRKLIRGIGEAEERAAMRPGHGKQPATKRLTSAKV